MKCSYANCNDTVTKPLVCKSCNQATYCSNNCRVQDFYKGHSKVCKTKSPVSTSSINPPTLKQGPSGSKVEVSDLTKSFNSFNSFNSVNRQNSVNPLTSSQVLKPANAKSAIKEPSPLDDYEITSKILGSGAYGQVKLVKYRSTGEARALKIISKQMLEEEKLSKEKIFEEISNHQELNHRNIIKYIDHFEDSKSIYIVLEYAEKGSLFDLVKNRNSISEDQAKVFFKQTVEGISYLHSCDIIHRDIKPENILISSSNEIKICDFGWCVKGGEMRSTFCGTLDYMAPEMVKGQPHSFEVDIWALGVLLYEMLHGYAPFEGMREADKCYNIVNCKLKFDSMVSPEAKDLINKMIQVNARDRVRLDQVMSHAFLASLNEKNLVKVGTSFRYYVQNYGMDDGVVESMQDGLWLVFFKKSGMKMKLASDEISRRLARNLKKEPSKAEEVEEGKVAKIAQMFEKGIKDKDETDQRKAKSPVKQKDEDPAKVDVFDSITKKLSLLAEQEKKNLQVKENDLKPPPNQKERKISPSRETNEKKQDHNKKSLNAVESNQVKKPSDGRVETFQSESESDSDVVIKPKQVAEISIKPSEKQKPEDAADSIFARLSQLADEEKELETEQSLKPSPVKLSDKALLSPNPYIDYSKSKEPSFLLSKLQDSAAAGKKDQSKKEVSPMPSVSLLSSLTNLPANRSESPDQKVRPKPVVEVKESKNLASKEFQIYNSLDAYIKAPVKRKRAKPQPTESEDKSLQEQVLEKSIQEKSFEKSHQDKPHQDKPPRSKSPRSKSPRDRSPRDKSLDKSLERFKEKYSEKPANAPNPFNSAQKQDLPERSSSPQFKNYEESNENDENPEILASGVFFKPPSRNKSPEIEAKDEESSSEENIFIKRIKQNMKQGSKEEPSHPFPVKKSSENEKNKPKFPVDSINSLQPQNIFTKQEKKDIHKFFSPAQSESPLRKRENPGLQNKSPEFRVSPNRSRSPKQRRSPKASSPINKKLKKGKKEKFEDMREKIENMHGDYYKSVEEAWIDKQVVLTAKEISDNEYEETGNTRTFSQYDEIFRNPPSIIGNFEDSNSYFKVSKEKLENQKKELQEMIEKMEKEQNVPIRIRREKKTKDGFLNWLGNIIGCSERY